MLAGDDAVGIGQHPVEILVAPDIEAALARNGNADRAPVGQGGHILDRQTQRHGPEAPAGGRVPPVLRSSYEVSPCPCARRLQMSTQAGSCAARSRIGRRASEISTAE